MKKNVYWVIILGLFLLITSKTAEAIPIDVGVFSWEEENIFLGPVFRVGNRSNAAPSPVAPGVSFSGVYIDLRCMGDCRQDDSEDDLGEYTISLGEILPGDEPHNFEDFTYASIISASLRLTFPLEGTVTVFDLLGPDSSENIIYNSPETSTPPGETTPVTEPSTLFLLGSGLAGIVIMSRRKLKVGSEQGR